MTEQNTPNKDLDMHSSESSSDPENMQETPASLDVLQEELSKTKDLLLRTLADMENLRKRSVRELEEASKYAISKLALEVLDIRDNLRRALENLPQENLLEAFQTFVKGIELTAHSLDKALDKFQIQEICPTGAPFDPQWHQAMAEAFHENIAPGHVIEVFQIGYRIHDRLLRPALVSVAKASS